MELARNGTLFLDDIAELDLALQAKLLRAIEEKKFYRVGGRKEIESDGVREIGCKKHCSKQEGTHHLFVFHNPPPY